MTDYATFVEGGVSFPITTSLDNSFVEDADPAIYHAVELYESVLNTYLLPRLSRESSRLPGGTIATCVAHKIYTDPAPHIQSKDLKFPILAVFRKRDEMADHTVRWEKATGTLNVVWVLPPMLGEKLRQMSPALHAAARILARATTRGFDPAHNAGASAWSAAGIQSATFNSVEYGSFDRIDSVGDVFPTIVATLTIVEREMPTDDDFEALGSIGLEVGVNDTDTDPLVTDDIEVDVTTT